MALAEFAREAAARAAVIAVGDANVSSLSDAYKLLREELEDAWIEAGFGLGHTFPGSGIPGSSRPQVAGILVPQWMARIDYVFYSDQMQAIAAHLAPFDGVSDHRGVVSGVGNPRGTIG